jgi:mono/diheme cytochrome c family protein
MRVLLGIAIGIILTIAAMAVAVQSGKVDMGADQPHAPWVRMATATLVERSIHKQAASVEVTNTDDPAMVEPGAKRYHEACESCHGAPGVERQPLAKGMRPQPPELKQTAKERSPAELFWITKHGVTLSGMPAWGDIYVDGEIWETVAFMRQLPDMEPDKYAAIINPPPPAAPEPAPEAQPAPAPEGEQQPAPALPPVEETQPPKP